MTNDLTDRLVIRELIERYSVALNMRDFSAMQATFLPDGVWRADPPFEIRLEGDAIVEGIAQMVEGMALLFQGLAGTVVTIVGDTASAQSSVHERGQHGAPARWPRFLRPLS